MNIQYNRESSLYPSLELETKATVDRENCQEQTEASQEEISHDNFDPSKVAVSRWGKKNKKA